METICIVNSWLLLLVSFCVSSNGHKLLVDRLSLASIMLCMHIHSYYDKYKVQIVKKFFHVERQQRIFAYNEYEHFMMILIVYAISYVVQCVCGQTNNHTQKKIYEKKRTTKRKNVPRTFLLLYASNNFFFLSCLGFFLFLVFSLCFEGVHMNCFWVLIIIRKKLEFYFRSLFRF